VPNTAQKCAAEFIATFALVFIGSGAICLLAVPGSPQNLIGIGLAHGLTITAMIAAIGHISGAHINPAVTIALLVVIKIEAPLAIAYIIAQLAGAVVAAFLLKEIFSPFPEAMNTFHLGSTTPLADAKTHAQLISPMMNFTIETILTFLLGLVIFGSAVDKRGPNSICALIIGATVVLDIMMGGPLTGASMNPARSFGPALASGTYIDHWVYWAGPIVGATLAALVYTHFVGKTE